MSIYITCIILLSVFLISFLAMPIVIKLAPKIGAVDHPDQRKVHVKLMPRLGGLAVYIAFMAGMLFSGQYRGSFAWLLFGATIVFAVGILDDIYSLSPLVKLLGQSMAAVIAILGGVVVQFITNPFDGLMDLGYLSIPLTFIWIVGVTNAVNLIDGLDGLAGGVSAIAAVTLGIVALTEGQTGAAIGAFIIVAALVGFLPYNFYPAKTFMGDGGSNLLGFLLAGLAIMGTAKSAAVLSLVVPIVILGIPLFDTFFAIIRRINSKSPIFSPDKSHLHHRLMALGMSHRRTVLIIYGISGFFGAIAVALTFISSPKATLLLAILLLAVMVGAERIGMFKQDNSGTGVLNRELRIEN